MILVQPQHLILSQDSLTHILEPPVLCSVHSLIQLHCIPLPWQLTTTVQTKSGQLSTNLTEVGKRPPLVTTNLHCNKLIVGCCILPHNQLLSNINQNGALVTLIVCQIYIPIILNRNLFVRFLLNCSYVSKPLTRLTHQTSILTSSRLSEPELGSSSSSSILSIWLFLNRTQMDRQTRSLGSNQSYNHRISINTTYYR